MIRFTRKTVKVCQIGLSTVIAITEFDLWSVASSQSFYRGRPVMRRTLWIFSAPVVAGGLAWAVNAADNQGLLQPRTAQTQPGKIFYFSRGGKTATPPTDAPDDTAPPDADDADAADQPAAPQRYVRTKTADANATSPPVKNFYQDLFSETETSAKDKSAPR